MRHPSIRRPHARGLIPAAGLAMAALIGGCERGQQREAVRATASSPPGGEMAALSRAQIATWASTLSYNAPDTTLAIIYGFAAGDSARIEPVEDAGGTSYVAARLTTANAYPAVGIGAGVNYVVIDSGSGGYNAVIIAADSSVGMRVHRVVRHAHEEGAAPPPRVGSMGVCTRVGCTRVWCRFSLDSLRTDSLARPRDLDLIRSRPITP